MLPDRFLAFLGLEMISLIWQHWWSYPLPARPGHAVSRGHGVAWVLAVHPVGGAPPPHPVRPGHGVLLADAVQPRLLGHGTHLLLVVHLDALTRRHIALRTYGTVHTDRGFRLKCAAWFIPRFFNTGLARYSNGVPWNENMKCEKRIPTNITNYY